MGKVQQIKDNLMPALGFFYPLSTHWAIHQGHPEWALYILGGVIFLTLLGQWSEAESTGNRASLWVPATGLVTLVLCMLLMDSAHVVLYLPPLIIIAFVLCGFARTLFPGKEPLITRISRVVFQDDTPGIEIHTRQWTWIWTLFLGGLLMQTLALTFWASMETWSLFTNVLNYVFMLLLFVMEFIIRIHRFGSRYSVAYCIQKLIRLPVRQLFKN